MNKIIRSKSIARNHMELRMNTVADLNNQLHGYFTWNSDYLESTDYKINGHNYCGQLIMINKPGLQYLLKNEIRNNADAQLKTANVDRLIAENFDKIIIGTRLYHIVPRHCILNFIN